MAICRTLYFQLHFQPEGSDAALGRLCQELRQADHLQQLYTSIQLNLCQQWLRKSERNRLFLEGQQDRPEPSVLDILLLHRFQEVRKKLRICSPTELSGQALFL